MRQAGPRSFRWLEAEFHRIQRKMEAKSRAIHSLRKQQAHEAQEQTMNRFKEYLVKKHGNLVRAWRVVLCSNDVMSIPKTPFLKACALMGFSHEARDLWHVLDKDESGFAALEELDPPSAEALARFKGVPRNSLWICHARLCITGLGLWEEGELQAV